MSERADCFSFISLMICTDVITFISFSSLGSGTITHKQILARVYGDTIIDTSEYEISYVLISNFEHHWVLLFEKKKPDRLNRFDICCRP